MEGKLTVRQGAEPKQLVCYTQPVRCYAGTGFQRRDEHGRRGAVYLGGHHHHDEYGKCSCSDHAESHKPTGCGC